MDANALVGDGEHRLNQSHDQQLQGTQLAQHGTERNQHHGRCEIGCDQAGKM